MEDLVEKSKRLKVEAENFYKISPLEVILQKFGNVSFRGSYDLGLMSKRDLDIYVIDPNMDRLVALNAFNKIAEEEFFYGYYLFDRKKFPKEGMPKGYYIGLKGYHNQRIWKVDIWFLTDEDEPSKNLMSYVKESLTTESKQIILKLKHYRDENGLEISGKEIYEAVLKDGIRTEQDLLTYLGINK